MRAQQSDCLGALGVNYNESLTWIHHDEIKQVGAQWVRGFVDMHQVDSSHAEEDPNIKALFSVADAGCKTILSFKWAYPNAEFPEPGSPNHATELERLDRLLQIVMGKVDILVIGNEPFIEAQQTDERLNVFYESLANFFINFRNTHNNLPVATRLYMGALNRLDLPVKRTPAIERFLSFIASKPELDGVDLHMHMPNIAAHKAMVNYALSKIRPDQTFLATEFSMIWHWKNHISDEASIYFCEKYGFSPGVKVYQVINAAFQTPMPYAQWEDFLRHEPWYMEYQNFMANTMNIYKATKKLHVATYALSPMRNRKRPLLAIDTPWMLNGLYSPSTVQLNQDGSRHLNFPWGEEFRKLQKFG
ncbi:hypothetical protein N7462_002335 [Penicillium macrosclerotiorum]|uniref:uncharacterized protein n=1 Tax=Penicillium macrosclerotiorum TaxID=303699 RepID=UPI0025472638|nr:uncharacterized protein N7462_002335 [Penicillium macrosclerotiorum]KAJ5692912.1 hypothetical protein N7462_002335 [Penicillium macrosclerotiorum]